MARASRRAHRRRSLGPNERRRVAREIEQGARRCELHHRRGQAIVKRAARCASAMNSIAAPASSGTTIGRTTRWSSRRFMVALPAVDVIGARQRAQREQHDQEERRRARTRSRLPSAPALEARDPRTARGSVSIVGGDDRRAVAWRACPSEDEQVGRVRHSASPTSTWNVRGRSSSHTPEPANTPIASA